MIRNDDFLGELSQKMEQLGMSADVPLEVVTGSQIYEIEGNGTRWAPTKGTVITMMLSYSALRLVLETLNRKDEGIYVVIYFICFALIAGGAFAMMWGNKSINKI